MASSLAKRCCRLGAARFWGTTRLVRNAIARVLRKEIRGGMVGCTGICDLILNTLSSSDLPAWEVAPRRRKLNVLSHRY